MPSDADYIADRRRLRRKLTFWRVLGVLAVVAVVVVGAMRIAGVDPTTLRASGDHVARVSITGVITNDRDVADMLEELERDQRVRGVVVSIDSPGGTTTGAEQLYAGLRALAEAKPMIAFVDGFAASGGYIAALGADRIVSRQTALVGSVGVIVQAPNVSDLLDEIGVRFVEVKSTPLKAAPSTFQPVDPAAVEALQIVVDDTYAWFVDLVGERRPLSPQEVALVSDGRVHNGRQALALGLVDELGSEQDAVRWLEQERGVPVDLPIRDREPDRAGDRFDIFAAGAALARVAGLDRLADGLAAVSRSADALQLDGMLVLWQPHSEN